MFHDTSDEIRCLRIKPPNRRLRQDRGGEVSQKMLQATQLRLGSENELLKTTYVQTTSSNHVKKKKKNYILNC